MTLVYWALRQVPAQSTAYSQKGSGEKKAILCISSTEVLAKSPNSCHLILTPGLGLAVSIEANSSTNKYLEVLQGRGVLSRSSIPTQASPPVHTCQHGGPAPAPALRSRSRGAWAVLLWGTPGAESAGTEPSAPQLSPTHQGMRAQLKGICCMLGHVGGGFYLFGL